MSFVDGFLNLFKVQDDEFDDDYDYDEEFDDDEDDDKPSARAIPFILSMKPAGYQRYFLHITN